MVKKCGCFFNGYMGGKIDFSNISGADWFRKNDIEIRGWGKLEIYQEWDLFR